MKNAAPNLNPKSWEFFFVLTSARKASFWPSVDCPNSIGSENESGAKSPSNSPLVSFRVSLQ